MGTSSDLASVRTIISRLILNFVPNIEQEGFPQAGTRGNPAEHQVFPSACCWIQRSR